MTKLHKKILSIDEVFVPEKYLNLFEKISLDVQREKAKQHNLSEEFFEEHIKQLQKRPFYLTTIAEKFDAKNILEVGTAQGLQFFSFAEHVKNKQGHVWSCDIVDVRNKECSLEYAKQTTFCLGDSKKLSNVVDKEIDLFYIDGAHDYGSVIKDVLSLRHLQSKQPIWIFDDYDERFGCFEDIKRLCEKYESLKYYVGKTMSGQPNHQAIIFGRI